MSVKYCSCKLNRYYLTSGMAPSCRMQYVLSDSPDLDSTGLLMQHKAMHCDLPTTMCILSKIRFIILFMDLHKQSVA